jgi:protein transport protein SEC24
MRFANDLKYQLSRSFGFDAVLRVRVSNGLKTEDHYGNFYMRNATDMEISGIDALKSFAVALKHEGKLEERGDSYVQAALLYTTSDGNRRIRLHNLQLGNTTETQTVFRHAEIDVVVNYLCKASIAKMTSAVLADVRQDLWNICLRILIAYRLHCSTTVMPAQVHIYIWNHVRLTSTYTEISLSFRKRSNCFPC